MLTSLPSPTVELHAEDSVAFSLDNLGASASKLWHVIIPVCPFDSVAVEHVTVWVTLIQHLFFEYTSWTVLEAAHGFIWNHTVAALPRHSCLEEKENKTKRFISLLWKKKWRLVHLPTILSENKCANEESHIFRNKFVPVLMTCEYARFENIIIFLHVVVSMVCEGPHMVMWQKM